MLSLYGALPGSYMPVRVTRIALVAHRYTFSIHRCRTSQYWRTFIPLSVSLQNDLADPVFDGVGLADFKSRDNAFFIGLCCSIPFSILLFFSFTFFCV